MIRIQNLHKYFNKGNQNEIHVIDGIDLELPERGMTAIFGKSGCGKTTLLNVIGGLDDFASGSVTIENQDIRANTDDLRNRYIGYIFQNYNLNREESCFDNVADSLRLCGMTDEAEIERRVTAALKNVGMEKYAKRPPNTLSGGQQQRIAIARAIVKNPRIILADEPTGNLDEANTVMIMDLLKSISETHLVLLVTHEAHLVDHYCDTVIELSDGKVVGTRTNANANGYSARDKNHIYLGELEKSELADEKAQIEYYGDKPAEPLRLRIVNNGGKLYVEIQSEKVQLLDGASEVRLLEGVFEEKKTQKQESTIDMSALPPVEATQTGKLFSFGSSLRSGYAANFTKNKRGKKILRACMCMFSAIIVLMTAIFGTSIGNILEARDSYNHNIFYLYTPDGKVSDRLMEAMQSGEGEIDFLRLHDYYPSGDNWIDFRVNAFETFQTGYYANRIDTRAAFLERRMAEGLEVIAGTVENLKPEEILITRKVADALLEQSPYGYISEYRDLIGMISNTLQTKDGKNPRIAGIVESDEIAVYFDEIVLAKYTYDTVRTYGDRPYLASDYGLDVKKGEVIYTLVNAPVNTGALDVGQKIELGGAELAVSEILRSYRIYSEYLEGNGIKKLSSEDWFADIVRTENPGIAETSSEFKKKCEEVANLRIADYYDYYYEHLDAFLADCYRFNPDEELWLYFEKGCTDVRYRHATMDYYWIKCYRELYGKTPTAAELEAKKDTLPELDLIKYYNLYIDEYYSKNVQYLPSPAYLVSDEDYVMLSGRIGSTDEDSRTLYTIIHSTDPKVTEEWLTSEFSHLDTGIEFMKPILTPDIVFQTLLEAELVDIIGGLVSIVVLLAIMSIR
ncbi:MAG: ABC transporter ATP-binding protein, partial [Clostridia bacterium]|nr:ABC transporter ATP-binding protein [Clostridia bacterium]